MRRNDRFVIVILLLSFTVSVCGSPRRDWEMTQKKNSIAAYEEYLKKHTTGEFIEEARTRLAALREQADWDRVTAEHSEASFRSYLGSYPEGRHVHEADSSLEAIIESEDWNVARTENTSAAYESFLSRHPAGRHSIEACSLLGVHPVHLPHRIIARIEESCGHAAVFFTSRISPINRLEDLKGKEVGGEYINYTQCVAEICKSAGLRWDSKQQDVRFSMIGNAYFEALFRDRPDLYLFVIRNRPESVQTIQSSGGIRVRFLPMNGRDSL